MISGILVSQHIFVAGSGRSIEFGRHLHIVATAWGFILMSVYLGLHWSIFSAIAKKVQADEKVKKSVHIICRVFYLLCVRMAYINS